MCLNHPSPSGIACLLFARGLLTPSSEVRRHLAGCSLQAGKVLLYCIFFCAYSIAQPPQETRRPPRIGDLYQRSRAGKRSAGPPHGD